MNHPAERILILGGGLAGLSAACQLAQAGFEVTLLESRNRLGGRAGSFVDPSTGQLVDVCQHVSMGCCTAFNNFCSTLGIGPLFARQPVLYFMTPDRRISTLAADPFPAPFHLARSLLKLHYLTFADKLRIGWGMLHLLRSPADADPPLLPWLRYHRQNERTIERFWKVVLVSALNESLDRLGLKYTRKVFVDGFLRSRGGYEVYLPTVPLGKLYGEAMQEWFTRHGVRIELNAGVEALEVEGERVAGVKLRDGRRLAADQYVSAVSFERLRALLPPSWRMQPTFAKLAELEGSPITSVHLWFDRPVMQQSHVVLVDCLGHWIFNRGALAGSREHYLQVVISASRALKEWGHQRIQDEVIAELRRLLPEATSATLLRARVITEHAATFSAEPGVDRFRPEARSPIANLFLAGDWTATGWPATMEGAVRSGILAAEAALGAPTKELGAC